MSRRFARLARARPGRGRLAGLLYRAGEVEREALRIPHHIGAGRVGFVPLLFVVLAGAGHLSRWPPQDAEL